MSAQPKEVEVGAAEKTDEDHWDAAWNHFQRWYESKVSDWVEDFKEERLDHVFTQLREGDVMALLGDDALLDDTTEHMDQWLHEGLDGCAEVIYNNKAAVVVLISSNAGAYAEEIGEAPPNVNAQAFWALRTDIMEDMD